MASFEKYTVLVVDDSYPTVMVISQILHHELKFGTVLNASNGEQALEIFANNQVDWIFSDVEMPEVDGLDLLASIRKQERGKTIPFIIMSAHTDKETIAKAMGAGATAFIAKPFNAASIIEKVRRIGELPVAGHKEPRQRRRVNRVTLKESMPCHVWFAEEREYDGEIVNLSLSGCLARSLPFINGGTIYDPIRLKMSTGEETLSLKAVVRRMEAEKKSEAPTDRMTVLTGIQFIGLDVATLTNLKTLITRIAQN